MRKRRQNHNILALLLLVVLLLYAYKEVPQTFNGFGAKKAEAVQNCNVSSSDLSTTPSQQTLLNLINAHRAQNGVSALTMSPVLKQASAWMSQDMSTNARFSHIDSLGRDSGARLRDCGYNWADYGENIFPNSTDAQAAFDAWRNSPPHNANMLNSTYKEAGIGMTGGYWTLDLGASFTSSNVTPPAIATSAPTTQPNNTNITPSITREPTPTPTPSIILNPTDTKIKISIKLAGIGASGNKSPKRLTRPASVGIFDLENKQVLSGNAFLKYNGRDGFEGEVHLGQLANGKYYVKVASKNTLISKILPEFQNLQSDKPNVLPSVTLTQGDLNDDNVIDISDFNLALPCFQSDSCTVKVAIDINDDGLTNVIDYNLFLGSFKRFEGD